MTAPEPMKAQDLKAKIPWGTPDRFAAITAWLTPQWAMERKIDGCRAMLEIGAARSRFGGNRSGSFPALASVAIPDIAGTILDGEFTAPHRDGRSLLGDSAGLFNSGPGHAARLQRFYGPAEFHVFDVLAICGENVTGHTYDQRRDHLAIIIQILDAAAPATGIRLVPRLDATASAIEAVLADGGEGVMLKRRASVYSPGVRSADWLKVKQMTTVDCWLTGGYRPGRNGRAGTVGSVEIAVTTGAGGPWVIGHCAVPPGWADAVTAPAGGMRPDMTGTVIEVMAQSVGVNGKLRHPHLVRLRPDKSPDDCGEDQMEAFARA